MMTMISYDGKYEQIIFIYIINKNHAYYTKYMAIFTLHGNFSVETFSIYL